jgi:Tfp pilus assembly protein PilN
MIEINLLPKELRKKGKGFVLSKNTLYLLSGGVAVIILMILVTTFQTLKLRGLDKKIMEAQRKKEQLRENIQMVDAISELKNSIIRRMSAIEELDRNRSTWIEVLQDLSDRVPEYVWLSSFKENPKTQPRVKPTPATGSEVTPDTLNEVVQEQTFISDMTIEGSNYFKNIELNFVRAEAMEDQKVFVFQLAGNLLYSSEASKEVKLKQKMREPETGS